MKDLVNEAHSGNSYAMLALAFMYHHGRFSEQDFGKAMEYYIQSSTYENPIAYWELSKIFGDGEIVEFDADNYFNCLTESASAGIPQAQFTLAMEYYSGDKISPDYNQAFNWMFEAASNDLPMAQFILGYMLDKGIGTYVNIEERDKWFSKLSSNGDAEMFYWIGSNYEFGINGVVSDYTSAKKWYGIGATMGHEKCIFALKVVEDILSGSSPQTQKDREAYILSTEAEKEKTLKEAHMEMGDRFLNDGEFDKAYSYYMNAAQLEHPLAMFTLSLMYHDGIFVERNDRKSLELLKKASLAGSEEAQYMLGDFSERGMGVPKNIDKAVHYFTLAAKNGNLLAYYKLSKYVVDPMLYVMGSSGGF